MSSTQSRGLRIGEVAARVGTTPRTIRYYEEIGLLPGGSDRACGAHRAYSEADVERIGEILRLKDLLGLTLDAVQGILEAEEARRLLRERFEQTEDPAEQQRIAADALAHVEHQLELVRGRLVQLQGFEEELSTKRRKVRRFLANSTHD